MCSYLNCGHKEISKKINSIFTSILEKEFADEKTTKKSPLTKKEHFKCENEHSYNGKKKNNVCFLLVFVCFVFLR